MNLTDTSSSSDYVTIDLNDEGNKSQKDMKEGQKAMGQEQVGEESKVEKEQTSTRLSIPSSLIQKRQTFEIDQSRSSPSIWTRLAYCFSCRCEKLASLQAERLLPLEKPSLETWIIYHHHLLCLFCCACILILLYYSMELPWFESGAETLVKQPNGEPFHANITIYLTYYLAYIPAFDMKIQGVYTDFAKPTVETIELSIAAVKLTEIFCFILIVEKLIQGLIFRFRRWRERNFADGVEKVLCFSSEPPSPNSFQNRLETWSQRISFSNVYRYSLFFLYFTVGLFCIVNTWILYPIKMQWQETHTEEAPEGSPLKLILMNPNETELALGWYLFFSSVLFWIATFYLQLTYTSIHSDLLYHIEELHGPWEIEKVFLEPLRSFSSGIGRKLSSSGSFRKRDSSISVPSNN